MSGCPICRKEHIPTEDELVEQALVEMKDWCSTHLYRVIISSHRTPSLYLNGHTPHSLAATILLRRLEQK